MPTDADRTRILHLLQAEGAAVLLSGTYLYSTLDLGWLLFVGVFVVPDIFMVGYLVNQRTGAILYNAVHTYLGPIALAAYAILADVPSSLLWGVIYVWFAHIGLDRMILAGLKYPTAFKHTHLSPPSVFQGSGA